MSGATVSQGPAVARGAVRDFQVSRFDSCTALLPDWPNPEAEFRTITGVFRGRNRCILPGILAVSREMCSFVVQRGTPPPVAGHPWVPIFKEIRRRPRDPPQSRQQLRRVRVTFLLPQKSPIRASCPEPLKQQLGTALPLRERRALCCSMVPFGEGLGSSLGFDAPFSLLDAAAYVDGRPGKRTTQTTLTTTRADLGEHPPGTYCRPGSTACGLGRRARYGLRFHRPRDPTAIRRHSTFVANSGFGSRGEGPLPSSGVRTNS